MFKREGHIMFSNALRMRHFMKGASITVIGGMVSFTFTVPAEKFNVVATSSASSSSAINAATVFTSVSSAIPLSWAIGSQWTSLTDTDAVTSNMEHSFFSRAATTVDFATGAAIESAASMDAMLTAHAWLTTMAWLLMVPLGAYIARGMKYALGFPGWLHWHLVMNVGAIFVSVVGVASSSAHLYNRQVKGSSNAVAAMAASFFETKHTTLGSLATLLSLAQVAGALYRPGNAVSASGRKSVLRLAWEASHKMIVSVACVGLAVAASYTGLEQAAERGWLGRDTKMVYTRALSGWIAAVATAAVVGEAVGYFMSRRKRSAECEGGNTGGDRENDGVDGVVNEGVEYGQADSSGGVVSGDDEHTVVEKSRRDRRKKHEEWLGAGAAGLVVAAAAVALLAYVIVTLVRRGHVRINCPLTINCLLPKPHHHVGTTA